MLQFFRFDVAREGHEVAEQVLDALRVEVLVDGRQLLFELALLDQEPFFFDVKRGGFVVEDVPERASNVARRDGFGDLLGLRLVRGKRPLVFFSKLENWGQVTLGGFTRFFDGSFQNAFIFHQELDARQTHSSALRAGMQFLWSLALQPLRWWEQT